MLFYLHLAEDELKKNYSNEFWKEKKIPLF